MSEWSEKISTRQNRPYYINSATGESVWDKPDGFVSQSKSQVRCSHLLVKHKDSRRPSSWKEPVVTRTLEEAMAEIVEFRKQLESKSVEFADLAKVESHCSSASKGGDLGWFGKGQMQSAFETVAYSLEVGELSAPAVSDSGVHLILRTG